MSSLRTVEQGICRLQASKSVSLCSDSCNNLVRWRHSQHVTGPCIFGAPAVGRLVTLQWKLARLALLDVKRVSTGAPSHTRAPS